MGNNGGAAFLGSKGGGQFLAVEGRQAGASAPYSTSSTLVLGLKDLEWRTEGRRGAATPSISWGFWFRKLDFPSLSDTGDPESGIGWGY